MKGKTVFITGGSRSGKSSFALASASVCSARKGFIATATPSDEEMSARIARHRADRGGEWQTFEEPLRLARQIEETSGSCGVIVVDCLTVWLSNLIWSGLDVSEETGALVGTCKKIRQAGRVSLYIVSNEVGMGIVPENEIARRFRDLAGILNQRIAALSDEVYLVTAGIPLRLKGEGGS